MEVSLSCVPVTALHACRLGDQDLLLSGEGASLYVYNCVQRQERLRQRVFDSQVIHGISSQAAPSLSCNGTDAWVLLWAGCAAAILHLRFQQEECESRAFLRVVQSFVVELVDWALYGDFFRSSDPEVTRAYLVTAQNEVHQLLVDHTSPAKCKKKILAKLVSGPSCVLYSAHARHTSRGLLVAAGTVFGEIVVWSANKEERSDSWNSKILNVALGHKGSVFGVSLSDVLNFDGQSSRLLASCSDDRTVKLWKVDGESSRSDDTDDGSSHLVRLSDVTGFGDADNKPQSLLANAWGHSSRIWTVKFLPASLSPEKRRINLISTGEDASFHLWEATLGGSSAGNNFEWAELRNLNAFSNHSGKNIWSYDYHILKGKYVHYTGGADGSIVATSLKSGSEERFETEDICIGMSFNDVLRQIELNEPGDVVASLARTTSFKQYTFSDDGSILATTETGVVLCGKLRLDRPGIVWRAIRSVQSKASMLLCSDRDTGSIFFSRVGGNLHALKRGSGEVSISSILIDSQAIFMCTASREDRDTSESPQSSIVIPFPHKCSVTLIDVSTADTIHLNNSVQLTLPPNFIPTSACHHVKRTLLLLGSRSGSIALFDNLVEFESPAAVFTNLHGTDTVTSLTILKERASPPKQTSGQDLFVLTTGRDGTYAVHKICLWPNTPRAPTLHTVHRTSSPIGPHIEGSYLVRKLDRQSQELLLYGFKSKDFVVWNETRQIEELSIDCGGAHRSWAYSPMKEDTCGEIIHGGNFVWTKAGACNVYKKFTEDLSVVKNGGHGREIKSLAASPVRVNIDSLGIRHAQLVATGAEDTTVRLFMVEQVDSVSTDQACNSKLVCLRVLNKHTTGIHHLEFSPCGNYLVSSGGCEELFVWRVNTEVPVIGVGVVLECMLPKTEIDADARITSFRVRNSQRLGSESTEATVLNFNIAATYSNGKIKIFGYSYEQESRRGSFEMLQEIVEGTFCLTRLHCMDALDGDDDIILTAGTNGYVNLHLPIPRNIPLRHRVHQNSIQAFLLVTIHQNPPMLLVITGGDDNAIGFTMIYPSVTTFNRYGSALKTLLVPSAHAAAVTDLALLSQTTLDGGSHIVTIASASNDQRVKIWQISIHSEETPCVSQNESEMQSIQIEKVAECWTNVADAAAIQVLNSGPCQQNRYSEFTVETAKFHQELLVVGVGMEIIKIPCLPTFKGSPVSENE